MHEPLQISNSFIERSRSFRLEYAYPTLLLGSSVFRAALGERIARAIFRPVLGPRVFATDFRPALGPRFSRTDFRSALGRRVLRMPASSQGRFSSSSRTDACGRSWKTHYRDKIIDSFRDSLSIRPVPDQNANLPNL
eukprot:9473416-Pyramimonas_sp.AAC.2